MVSNTLLAVIQSLNHVQLFVTPMDYTVHGILQARILEWVAFPFSKGSSQPRGQTQVTQSQRKAMPKNAQTTAQLHSYHTLVK